MLSKRDPASHVDSIRKERVRQPLRSLHLLYHELRPQKSNYSYVVQCENFEKHVDLFTRLRQAQDPGLRPEITFDDGHISNYEYALPILQKHGIQAHFFITVGWTGQKPGYMGWQELRALHLAGQLIGAHGWSHTLLTHCTGKQLQLELKGARQTLEDKLGTPITTMSLPGGRFNRDVMSACQEAGYTQVFTSIPQSEPIPSSATVGRLNIRGDVSLDWIASLFKPDSTVLANLQRQERVKAAAKAVLGDRIYAKLWALLNRQELETIPGEAYEDSAHHQ
jgi:peptidoglycan/xylan/chitin deacetylase (PgdA/CDA1 family)